MDATRLFGGCFVLLLAIAGFGTTRDYRPDTTENLRVVAVGINAITPKTLEGGGRLVRASAEGKVLTFEMDEMPSWRPELSDAELITSLSAMICADDRYRRLLGEGGRFRFVVRSKVGETVPPFTVSECTAAVMNGPSAKPEMKWFEPNAPAA